MDPMKEEHHQILRRMGELLVKVPPLAPSYFYSLYGLYSMQALYEDDVLKGESKWTNNSTIS